MNPIIKKYINLITDKDINTFALKHDIKLSKEELDVLYYNIKNNFDEVLKNTESVFNRIQNKFSNENSIKIHNLLNEYKKKYKNYL